jgi:hypothetical protein
MSNNEKILLHDYFDNLLSQEKQKEFEETLLDNIDLAIDLGKLKNLQRNLRNLPSNFTPSEKVIENIINSLLEEKVEKLPTEEEEKNNKKKKKKEKKSKKKRKGLKAKTKFRLKQIFITSTFLLFIAIIGIGYYYYQKENSTFPWKITSISKTISPELQKLIATGLSKRTKLVTSANEKAVITVSNKGTITLLGECKFTLLNGSQSKNSINFEKGNLIFAPHPANILFELQHNGITINSKNSEFEIKSEAGKHSIINVISNYLEIKIDDVTKKVPNNHSVKILNNNIGFPTVFNISPKFAKLISMFEIEPSDKILLKIIKSSKISNSFTLLALLSKVSPTDRELIIDRLNKFIPMPPEISKVDILLLDEEALNIWWEEIYRKL